MLPYMAHNFEGYTHVTCEDKNENKKCGRTATISCSLERLTFLSYLTQKIRLAGWQLMYIKWAMMQQLIRVQNFTGCEIIISALRLLM